MTTKNKFSEPMIVEVRGPFIVPRRFTIEQLAQYLGITNFAAEEKLRKGEIKFKWAGQRKVVERADADAWADAQPYADVTVRTRQQSPFGGLEWEPVMTDAEAQAFFAGTKRTEEGYIVGLSGDAEEDNWIRPSK